MIKDTCFRKNGKPLYLIGANYWPRDTGPLMWRDWSPEKIKGELKEMKEMGMNVCRSFLYFPDFMPEPGTVNEKMLERFKEFLSLCEEVGIYTIPSLFVGHMSGEDWDVEWRGERNFYSDDWMLKQETLYTKSVVATGFKSHSILAWLLSNEITNYAGKADHNSVMKWLRTIQSAIRQFDRERPISTGEGVWGREVYGKDNGFRLTEQKEIIDFIGPHFYIHETDALRHSHIPSFTLKMSKFGKPVLLQEFGCSNCYASEKHQADYYRTVYHSAFLSGAVGTICWCFSDFNLPRQRPYAHHAHELLFGVKRGDGSIKPAGEEIQRFSKILDKIDLDKARIVKDKSYLLVPSYYVLDYPYSHEDKKIMREVLLQSYVLSKQAHLNPEIYREPFLGQKNELGDRIKTGSKPEIDKRVKLLISPNLQKLTSPFWEAVYEWIEGGGIFYSSFHIDPWNHIFEKIFGARHRLRFGLGECVEDNETEIEFISSFHGIKEGEKIHFPVKGEHRKKSFCPVDVTSAEVIAIDRKGNPAILKNRIGNGTVIFSTYPLEYYLAVETESHSKNNVYRIYESIKKLSGIEMDFSTDNPLVELGTVKEGERGNLLLWIINHSWKQSEGLIDSRKKIKQIKNFENGKKIEFREKIPYNLPPKEVGVLEIITD